MISELCLCKQLRVWVAAHGIGKVQHINEECVIPGAVGICLPKWKDGLEDRD